MKKYVQNIFFSTIGNCADEMGQECYVIGGYVRDIFLERPSKDIDIVVVGNGIELAEKVCKIWGNKAKLNVFKNFGTAQIKYKDMEIEFVGARKESYRSDSRKPIVENGSLEDDQNRRDFSINALAICLNKEHFGKLLDPFQGVRDLEYKILRTPLSPDITFSDDPLRIIRCIRFATQLHFHIEENTFAAIARNKERLSIVSKERIVDELQKIMMSPKPSIGWILLEKCELLPYILPELLDMKGIETKSGIAHKDNFYHTLEVLDNISKHTDNVWLRWGALLHDIAKPVTKRFVTGIGWTFYNHNFIGEKMVARIFNRMKLPMNEKMKYVQKMVLLHMRPISLVEEEITDSAVRRLLFDAGDDVDDLMTLCEADITSKNESKVQRFLLNLQQVRKKLKDIEEKDRLRNFQPPISGEEIMQTFNLPACATVGEIKMRIKDAILDGEIPNEYEPAKALMLTYGKELDLEGSTQN
ncbi:MAG: HD domain-containing protein [Paludibacteraceae bacterium]|nr:HD domain-containing protein [Paludibacteraceae bacterium]MBP6283831.1 HD domain-containing protein [Paludibacteraceae bacterium]